MPAYPKSKQLAWNKVDKPEKYKHERGSLRQRDRGKISAAVRKEVEKRSGDCCERCGRHKSAVWTLEMAHIERRWKLDQTTANDLVRLCGPSTDSTTCHHFADYSREGRNWLEQFGKLLREGA